jgi:anti-sigma factor RsiW
MRCAERLRAQAYFDDELDSVSTANIERHRIHCAQCNALLDDLEQVRTALRQDVAYASTPRALRARVMRALNREGAAKRALLDDLLSAHVRSLMPDHLIDVISTDRHTVKPWFAGPGDVSPVVADFDAQGYRLIGARTDYFEHQRAAVIVYQRGSRVINVFSWAGSARPTEGRHTQRVSPGVLEGGESGVLRSLGYRLG